MRPIFVLSALLLATACVAPSPEQVFAQEMYAKMNEIDSPSGGDVVSIRFEDIAPGQVLILSRSHDVLTQKESKELDFLVCTRAAQGKVVGAFEKSHPNGDLGLAFLCKTSLTSYEVDEKLDAMVADASS